MGIVRSGAMEAPGVTVHFRDGTRIALELAAEGDDQVVLTAALSTGRVREFARHPSSLLLDMAIALHGGVRSAPPHRLADLTRLLIDCKKAARPAA